MPGVAVHVAEALHVGFWEEEVYALTLVDPLLAACGGIDDGFVADFEDGLVLLLEVVGDAFDVGEFAVEVFELVDHVAIPEAFFFEVVDEDRIEDGEVATEVTLHKEVGVVWLDAGGGAHDVTDGGSRCDGEDVGVSHAVLGDCFAHRTPVHFTATGDFDFDSPFVFEAVDGVLREDAAIPFGAFVAVVGAALACEFAAGTISIVADRFHEFVVEVNGGIGGELEVLFEEGVLKAHDAEANGTVTAVCGFGRVGGVEVDIDDVIERTNGDGDGLAEHLVVEHAVFGNMSV